MDDKNEVSTLCPSDSRCEACSPRSEAYQESLLGQHALFLLPFLLISASILFKDFFLSGLPTGSDLGTHFYLAREKYALLIETGFWDGLLPQWYLGFSPFAYYPDLFYWLFSALKYVLTPIVNDEDIFKLLLMATFYLPIFGGYYLTFVLTNSRLFSLFGAFLILSVSVFAGVGFHGHFHVGLVNQSLGTGFYLFCLALSIRWMTTASVRFGILSAAAFILVIQAHLISMVACTLSLCLLFSVYFWRQHFQKYGLPNWRRLVKPALVWIMGSVVCLGSLTYRVFSYWGERGGRSGFGDIQLMDEIVTGKIFSSGFVNCAAVVIILFALYFKGFRLWCAHLLLIGLAFFILGTGYLQFGGELDIFNSIFRHRAWGFTAVLWMVLCASGLAFIWQANEIRHRGLRVALRCLVVLVAATCVWSASGRINEYFATLWTLANCQFEQKDDYMKLLERINQDTPPDSVLVYEIGGRDHKMPFISPSATLAIYAKKVLMQGHQVESSKMDFNFLIQKLGNDSPEFACDFFKRTGATHYLAWTPHVVQQFETNPCFQKALSEGHFHLFAYNEANFSRASGNNIKISSYYHSRHRYLWVVNNGNVMNTLVLKFSYHPRFSLEINGKRTAMKRTDENLISVEIPAGESVVTLTYSIPPVEKFIGIADKLIAILALFILLLHLFSPTVRWRRRPKTRLLVLEAK